MTPTIADVLEGRERWCVIQGDCLQILPTMPEKCVAHVITDPPYEAEAHTLQRRVKRSDDAGDEVLEMEPLSFAPLTEEIRTAAAHEFARLAQRWIAAFCQVEAAMKWSDSLTAHGAPKRRIGVWVKPDGQPQLSGDRPGMGYESIVFAHPPGRSRWNGGGRSSVFIHNKNCGGKHIHETQKPLLLMLELVELFTDQGDLVLDPFCGSGTTGVACLRLGRRFIGIEKDATYAALARERMEAEGRGLTLRDARAGQLSLLEG